MPGQGNPRGGRESVRNPNTSAKNKRKKEQKVGQASDESRAAGAARKKCTYTQGAKTATFAFSGTFGCQRGAQEERHISPSDPARELGKWLVPATDCAVSEVRRHSIAPRGAMASVESIVYMIDIAETCHPFSMSVMVLFKWLHAHFDEMRFITCIGVR